MTRLPGPPALLVGPLLALVLSGAALGAAGVARDRELARSASDAAEIPRASIHAQPSSVQPSDPRDGEREGDEGGEHATSACHYAKPHPTPRPTPKAARSAARGSSVVLTVTGYVSAEGWVPPPGQTCPPEL